MKEGKPERDIPESEDGSVPLLIAGAPRSGAAIVARTLALGGVFLGDRFGSSENENLVDHLSDQDIVALHTRSLRVDGASWDDAGLLSKLPASNPDFFSTCATDALQKFQAHPMWGWKDFRAVFFLDAWSDLLPRAHWLFVLRRPAEIAWAAAASQTFANSSRWQAASKALDLWAAYNRRLLDFVERNPGRSTLLLLPDDLGAGFAALQDRLPRPWGETLAKCAANPAFDPWLLRARSPHWVQAQVRMHRSVGRLWRALQAHRVAGHPAASLRRKPGAPARGSRRVAVFSRARLAHSETFIQAHISGLPARVDWLLASKPGAMLTSDEIPLCTLRERVMGGVWEALGTRTDVYSTRAIARYLKRRRIEAVLAEFGTVAVKVMEACRMQGVPLIAHFHGRDATSRTVIEANREAYQRLFKLAAALVVVSREMEKQLRTLGAPEEKIHYNPCSVDLGLFHGASPGTAPPTFLATGRYVNKKAPHLTLLAFAQVLEHCPDARLLMVGDGLLKPVCEDLVRTLGIESAVRFIGFLPHVSIAALMRSMRGFVQHSVEAHDGDSEGTPVAVTEAAAAGLPIVGTAHAGIKEVVRHGETGFLVTPGDVRAMASHWTSLARDAELAQRLGAEGRLHVQDSLFERNRSLANLWRIIEQTMPVTDG